MNLVFSVLWFDDSEAYFESLPIDDLKDEIVSWGFGPSIKFVSTPEEFLKHEPFRNIDLIVVDKNLESYEDGQNFIKKIRDHSVYTEVIFYSAGEISKLWDGIYEKRLEGIFVTPRDNVISKIISVGQQSVSKVLDLENMRGIVMAEVGELDHLLDEIITLGMISLLDEQQKSIFKRFYEGTIKQNQDFKDRLDVFSKNPETTEMLNLCDSNKRWQNFNRLWKKHHKLKDRERIGEYDKDILYPRNFLAHGKSELHQDGGFLFRHQGKELLFDDTVSLELRQTILSYKQAFVEILSILQE